MSDVLSVDVKLRRGTFDLAARFAVPLQGVTAVFGPSGAGKSLLLSAIAGLARLEDGRVALGARVVEDARQGMRIAPYLRGIGLVFQEARLFPHLSVRGNLEYAQRRAPAREGVLTLDEAAERFEVGALLARPVRNLSGGEKARVALARALLSAPELLLLDEPFAALDGARRRAYLEALRDVGARLSLPMLVVTHQIEDAAGLACHIVGMRGGVVAASGPLAETVLTPAFRALLDARDVGAAIPRGAMLSVGGEGDAAWVRADHVLLAGEEPRGLSARNIWPGEVVALEVEADGARLASMRTAAGAVLARVTAEAAQELQLAVGRPVWAVLKAHAV